MARIAVGQLLVRCLRAEGVEMMSGIIDGAHIPIVGNTPKYGICEYVREQEQLGPALQRAVDFGTPALLHVQVDREPNTVPPGWEQFRKAPSVRW